MEVVSSVNALAIVAGLALVGIVAWLAANIVWLVGKWIGRAGGLSESDYLKLKEQHAHGGRG
jgi:hypothetical protein